VVESLSYEKTPFVSWVKVPCGFTILTPALELILLGVLPSVKGQIVSISSICFSLRAVSISKSKFKVIIHDIFLASANSDIPR
jgi:hypothetical protein